MALVERQLTKLERVALAAKNAFGFDIEQARSDDKRALWTYTLLDAQGAAAAVRPEDRLRMAADGLSDADIEAVDRHLTMLQMNALVPTKHHILRQMIEGVAAAPTAMNMGVAQGIVSDARLFELVEILLASKADVSLITEMARRGDLTTLATINTKCPKLLQAVLTLAQLDDESVVALNGILRNACEASSGAEEVLNAAVAASQHPGDVMRYLEVNRRGGVRARVLRWILRGAT